MLLKFCIYCADRCSSILLACFADLNIKTFSTVAVLLDRKLEYIFICMIISSDWLVHRFDFQRVFMIYLVLAKPRIIYKFSDDMCFYLLYMYTVSHKKLHPLILLQ